MIRQIKKAADSALRSHRHWFLSVSGAFAVSASSLCRQRRSFPPPRPAPHRNDQRRQQPDHIVAGTDHQHVLVAQGCNRSVLGTRHFRPSIRPWPRTSSNDGGCSSASIASFWLSFKRPRAPAPESRPPEQRRGPHCRPPWQADCRQRSSRGCLRSCPWPLLGGQAGAKRKAAADRLGDGHDVRCRCRPIRGRTACRSGPCRTGFHRRSAAGRAHRTARSARRNCGWQA